MTAKKNKDNKDTGKAQKAAPVNEQAPKDEQQQAPKANTKEPTQQAAEVKALKVRVKHRLSQFYRAGFRFTQAPVVLRVQDLSQKQIDMLLNEPRLLVEELTISDDDEA